jgi:hypothetical protein
MLEPWIARLPATEDGPAPTPIETGPLCVWKLADRAALPAPNALVL